MRTSARANETVANAGSLGNPVGNDSATRFGDRLCRHRRRDRSSDKPVHGAALQESLKLKDYEVLDLLSQSDGSSLHEFSEVTGVKTTTLYTRMMRLLDRGLVDREGGGAARHIFHVTESGFKELDGTPVESSRRKPAAGRLGRKDWECLDLLRQLGGSSVDDLSDAIDVKPNTFDARLKRLLRLGLVTRGSGRSVDCQNHRGPRYVYRTTEMGLQALDRYWLEDPEDAPPLRLEEVARHLINRIPGNTAGRQQFSNDHMQAMVWRFGLDGGAQPTLQECGDRVGLSRERIGQIETRYLEQLEHPRHVECVPLPDVLSQTFDIALGSLAGSGNLGRTLQDRGLSNHDEWNLEHLIALARLCGHRAIVSALQKIAEDQLEAECTSPQLDRLLTKATWEASCYAGFCHESACLRRLEEMWQEEEIAEPLPDKLAIKDHIAKNPSIKEFPLGFLFSAGTVDPVRHWRSSGRRRRGGGRGTRVIGQLMRMLAVSSPLRISDLRQGLNRYSRRTRVPLNLPSEVLRAFCEWHPAFQVADGDLVSATIVPGKPTGLSAWLVQQMQNSDYGFLTFSQAIERGRRHKENTNTLTAGLVYDVEITHDHRGAYFPIGKPPADELLRRGLRAAGRSAVPTTQEWFFDKGERVVRLNLEIGHSSLNGVLSVGSANHAYLDLLGERKFSIIDPSEERHGNLSVSIAMKAIKGLSTYFSNKCLEPGDEIEITIDLENQVANVDR